MIFINRLTGVGGSGRQATQPAPGSSLNSPACPDAPIRLVVRASVGRLTVCEAPDQDESF